MLRDVAAACRRAREAGAPIDVLVGDFNSVARSIGFDDLEAEGYALASRSSLRLAGDVPLRPPRPTTSTTSGPAATSPASAPEFFTELTSDHRGQVARFGWPAR